MIKTGYNADGDIIGRQVETLAQEIDEGKTYIVKARCTMRASDIDELEKELSKKTKANIIILDGRYELLQGNVSPLKNNQCKYGLGPLLEIDVTHRSHI